MVKPESSQLESAPTNSPQSAPNRKKQAIAIAVAIAALASLVSGGVLFAQSCPAGQQRQNGICTAASANSEIPKYSRFADVPDVPAAVVKYSGATAFAPLRSPVFVDKLIQSFPQFGLKYIDPPAGEEPGSTTGIRMLIAGQVDFAQASRPLKQEEIDQARVNGITLEAIPVAKDGIAFYVNPKLEVPGLTVTQLRDIYSGQVTNWQEVGGPNVSIQPVSRDPKLNGTADYLQTTVLENQPLGRSVQIVPTYSESMQRVGKSLLGGIGFGSAALVCGQTTVRVALISAAPDAPVLSPCGAQANQIAVAEGRYALTRELYIIVKKDGGTAEQAGKAYANLLRSRQGQDYMSRFGFVPVLKLSK